MAITSYIYLDLDGVLANFDKEVIKHRPDGNKDRKFGSKLCREQKGFYEALEIYPGAKEFVLTLQEKYGDRVRILSSAVTERQESWTEKAKWVEKHLPTMRDRVILCRTKDAVGALGDILIDDHPEWNGADKFRGIVLKFDTDNVPNEYDVILNKLKQHFEKEK